MSVPPSLLLLPLVLVSFENRVETRGHAFMNEDVRVDLLESPRVELTVTAPRETASLSYAPLLLLLSVNRPDSELAMFHTFNGRFTHTYRDGFVSFAQNATFGRNNLRLSLVPATPPDVSTASPEDTPPTPTAQPPTATPPGPPGARGPVFDEVAWFGSTASSVILGQVLTPRLNLYEYGTYSVQGGLDADARELYPPQQQQTVGGGVSYRGSLRDTVTSGVDVQRTSTSGLGEVYLFAARERWDRALSRRTSGSLSVGAAYAAERSEDGANLRHWLPLGELSAMTRWSGDSATSTVLGATGLAPAIDWRTGRLDHRLYAGVTFAQARQHYRWFTSASAITSLTPDEAGALTAAVLLAGMTRDLSRELALNAVISSSWQLFEDQETPALLWMGSIGLSYRPLPTRL